MLQHNLKPEESLLPGQDKDTQILSFVKGISQLSSPIGPKALIIAANHLGITLEELHSYIQEFSSQKGGQHE